MKELKEKVFNPIKDYAKSILHACISFGRTAEPEDAMRGRQYRLMLLVGCLSLIAGVFLLIKWGEWPMFLFSFAAFAVMLGWCVKMEYDYSNNALQFGYFLCASVKEGRVNDRYRFVGLPDTEFEQISFFLTRKKKEPFDVNGVYFMCFGKNSEQAGFNDETLKMTPILTEIGGLDDE